MAECDIAIIFNSLKELQQEKKRLENKLTHERARRKDLEAKVELVTARYNQTLEKHAKMQETVNIAKQKVKESQHNADSLQKIHEEKQASIADLKQKIKAEEQKRKDNLNRFSEQLEELASKFRNASQYYEDESLKETIKRWSETLSENENKVTFKKTEIDRLTQTLQELEIEPEEKEEKKDITEEELKTALEIFKEENKACEGALKKSKEKVASHMERVAKIKEELEKKNKMKEDLLNKQK